MNQLFEEIPFIENPQYERIIDNILAQQYCIVEDFFTDDEVVILRQSLIEKHEEDAFKKAAIGNRVNEIIVKSIRGDVILWIDELKANEAEMLFFNKINSLVNYLNRTCFLEI